MACSDFVTLTDLTLRYPALVAALDPLVTTQLIECADCKFDAVKWGCDLLEGSLAYVAHTMKMALAASTSTGTKVPTGQISSMSQGPVSASFAVSGAASEDSWMASTPEGLRFMSLRDCVATACTVNVSGGGSCFIVGF